VAVDLDLEELLRVRYMAGVDRARGRLRGDIAFVVADAQTLPFADSSFDKVMCTEVLEHVPDDVAALQELSRVLKPSGKLVLSVPAYLAERATWLLSPHYGRKAGGHLRIYRPGKGGGALRRHGFRLYATRYEKAFQSIYWLLAHLCGSRTRGPARFFKEQIIDPYERSAGPFLGLLEECANYLIPKDLVLYARKMGSPTQRQPDLNYGPDDFFRGPLRPDSHFCIGRLSEATMRAARRLRRGRILDVACGTAKEMIQLSQKGWQAWGLDASDKMLAVARGDAQQQGASVALVRSIAERLPFRDSSFDRLTCKGSLDHFADAEAFIREAARVLKPNGLAVIAVANYESLSCKLGRWLYPLFLRLGWMSRAERPYWVIPPDHTFRGYYDRITRLGDGWLELRKCFGVSLLWLFPGWGSFLAKLPHPLAFAILRTADSIARLTPSMGDVVISVWSPRPEVKRRRAPRRAGRQRRRSE